MKRIYRYTGISLLAAAAILLALPFLLYWGPVQRAACRYALDAFSEKYGLVLETDDFALDFPAELTLSGVYAGLGGTDTLAAVERLHLKVGLCGIFSSVLDVEELEVNGLALRVPEDSTGFRLRTDLEELTLVAHRVDLERKHVDLDLLALKGTGVDLRTGKETGEQEEVVEGGEIGWTLDWKTVRLDRVDFRMGGPDGSGLYAGTVSAAIGGGRLFPDSCRVEMDSVLLSGGWCHMGTSPGGSGAQDSVFHTEEREPEKASEEWTVEAGKLKVDNTAFSLKEDGAEVADILVTGIGVQLDSIYNRGTVLKARLKSLQAVEQKGMKVADMQAGVLLDTAYSAFQGVKLRTPDSRLELELSSESPVSAWPGKPLDVCLEGEVGFRDIGVFWADMPDCLAGSVLGVETEFSFSDTLFDLRRLVLEIPGRLRVLSHGRFLSWSVPDSLAGKAGVDIVLQDSALVGKCFPGTCGKLPVPLRLVSDFRADAGSFSLLSRMKSGQGGLVLDASCHLPQETYDADLSLETFPLGNFLHLDSLEKVTAGIRLSGRSFSLEKAGAEVSGRVDSLDYLGRRYRGIALESVWDRAVLSGSLSSRNRDADLDLVFRGDSLDGQYRLHLGGKVGFLDLYSLGIAGEPLALCGSIQAESSLKDEENCSLFMKMDSLGLYDASRRLDMGQMDLELESMAGGSRVRLSSGDFGLEFRTDTSLVAFVRRAGEAAGEISGQLKRHQVDMEEVDKFLPVFDLHIDGGRNNALSSALAPGKLGYESFRLDMGRRRKGGLRMGLYARSPYWNQVRLDSVQLGLWQTGRELMYALGVRSSDRSWKELSSIYARGKVGGDRIRVDVKQENAEGETGFDLGINTVLKDSAVSVSFFPVNPVLAYRKWQTNRENVVNVSHSGRVKADLTMESEGKLVSMLSLPDQDGQKERLALDIEGIELEALSRMFPFLPEMAGCFATSMKLHTREGKVVAEGAFGVDSLVYGGVPVGQLGLGLIYSAEDRFSRHALNMDLEMDHSRKAVLKGTFATGKEDRHLDMDADLSSLPLKTLSALVSPDLLRLKGTMAGRLECRGTVDLPRLDGGLSFTGGEAELVMLGTSFSLDSSYIPVRDGVIGFENYHLEAPDGSRMLVNGKVVLTPFDQMGMDLVMNAGNFSLVKVKKKEGSLIYGNALIDLKARMAGPFSRLKVNGTVDLLNGSDINYVLQDSDGDAEDGSTDMVRFVSFRDTLASAVDRSLALADAGGFTLHMLLGIDDQVKMGVDLTEGGNDRVNIAGGGNLLLSVEPENGMSLSGKYLLSGGNVEYNVPIVGKKLFTIRKGSFVEWTGNVANPLLNITAAEELKADVEEGESRRQAVFEALIRIRNNLSKPDISFDMAAPDDMVIQNQLNTFPPEERTRLALNLLVYNTYTPPGSSQSKTGNNMANNAIYSFVENELNKYTRKAGLTVGFDSRSAQDNTMHTDVTYQFSRQLFNDRVRVSIGGRISTDGSEGDGGSVEDNLVDDISIEYVLTKKRNLFVRIFRHSNYESVLDGEVTRTGGGLVWRKNFRKFRELFQNAARRGKKKGNKGNEDMSVKGKEAVSDGK